MNSADNKAATSGSEFRGSSHYEVCVTPWERCAVLREKKRSFICSLKKGLAGESPETTQQHSRRNTKYASMCFESIIAGQTCLGERGKEIF